MAKPFICNLTKEELEKIYNQEDMTADKMKDILGCKSKGTVLKILHKNGINTARNKKLGYKKRGNRTDEEFAEYLVEEYVNKKRSMTSIAKVQGEKQDGRWGEKIREVEKEVMRR